MANPNVHLGDVDETLEGIATILEEIRDELKKVNERLQTLDEIREELITLKKGKTGEGEDFGRIEYEGE